MTLSAWPSNTRAAPAPAGSHGPNRRHRHGAVPGGRRDEAAVGRDREACDRRLGPRRCAPGAVPAAGQLNDAPIGAGRDDAPVRQGGKRRDRILMAAQHRLGARLRQPPADHALVEAAGDQLSRRGGFDDRPHRTAMAAQDFRAGWRCRAKNDSRQRREPEDERQSRAQADGRPGAKGTAPGRAARKRATATALGFGAAFLMIRPAPGRGRRGASGRQGRQAPRGRRRPPGGSPGPRPRRSRNAPRRAAGSRGRRDRRRCGSRRPNRPSRAPPPRRPHCAISADSTSPSGGSRRAGCSTRARAPEPGLRLTITMAGSASAAGSSPRRRRGLRSARRRGGTRRPACGASPGSDRGRGPGTACCSAPSSIEQMHRSEIAFAAPGGGEPRGRTERQDAGGEPAPGQMAGDHVEPEAMAAGHDQVGRAAPGIEQAHGDRRARPRGPWSGPAPRRSRPPG